VLVRGFDQNKRVVGKAFVFDGNSRVAGRVDFEHGLVNGCDIPLRARIWLRICLSMDHVVAFSADLPGPPAARGTTPATLKPLRPGRVGVARCWVRLGVSSLIAPRKRGDGARLRLRGGVRDGGRLLARPDDTSGVERGDQSGDGDDCSTKGGQNPWQCRPPARLLLRICHGFTPFAWSPNGPAAQAASPAVAG
jgi:hypothetical protein